MIKFLKTLVYFFVGIFLFCTSGFANGEQYAKAVEESWNKEYPQIALSSQLPKMDSETVAANGELRNFIEQKVADGEAINSAEMIEVLSNSVSSDAEKTFKSYLADPIPQSVNIVEGKSVHWHGFSASLIFKTDKNTFEELKRGYARIPFERLKPAVKEWFKEDITALPELVCYFRNDTINKYYLFWDPPSGKVFFKGIEG